MPTPEEIIRHHDATAPSGASTWVEAARAYAGLHVMPRTRWSDDFSVLEAHIREAW